MQKELKLHCSIVNSECPLWHTAKGPPGWQQPGKLGMVQGPSQGLCKAGWKQNINLGLDKVPVQGAPVGSCIPYQLLSSLGLPQQRV